jgi:hypothetical protein
MSEDDRLIVYCPNLVPPVKYFRRALFLADVVGSFAPVDYKKYNAGRELQEYEQAGIWKPISLSVLSEEERDQLAEEAISLLNRYLHAPVLPRHTAKTDILIEEKLPKPVVEKLVSERICERYGDRLHTTYAELGPTLLGSTQPTGVSVPALSWRDERAI